MYSRFLIAIVCIGLGYGVAYLFPYRAPDTASGGSSAPPPRAAAPLPGKGMAPAVQERTPAVVSVAEVPPVKTLAETADIRSEFLQSAALYRLASTMGARGIRDLLDEAEDALSAGDYQGGTFILIGRYAELDFDAALDYALTNGRQLKANWLRAIFHARARLDLDDAVKKAQQLSQSEQQTAGVALLRSNHRLTAAERRSIVDALKIPDQIAATAEYNTAEAWANVQAIADPMERMRAQSGVLMRWAQSDPWAAFDASAEIENADMRSAIQAQLLGTAAADDPQRAIDWLTAQPEGEQRDQLTMAFVMHLNETNPEQAQAMIEALPPEKRVQAEMGLWIQRAPSDPEGAAAWVATLGNDSSTDLRNMERVVPMQVLSMLTMSSLDAAERFINALPAERRAELEPTYIGMLARQDPLAAAGRLDRIANSDKRQQASMRLISTWVRNDPAAAARWIDGQPGSSSPQLYRTLGHSWSSQSLDSARDYADDMRSGADRDQMYAGIISSGRINADSASEILDRIDDPKLHAEAEQILKVIR